MAINEETLAPSSSEENATPNTRPMTGYSQMSTPLLKEQKLEKRPLGSHLHLSKKNVRTKFPFKDATSRVPRTIARRLRCSTYIFKETNVTIAQFEIMTIWTPVHHQPHLASQDAAASSSQDDRLPLTTNNPLQGSDPQDHQKKFITLYSQTSMKRPQGLPEALEKNCNQHWHTSNAQHYYRTQHAEGPKGPQPGFPGRP